MKKKVSIGALLAILLIAGAIGGWQRYREAQLSYMVGQMILLGFRGTSPDDDAVRGIADDIRLGKIGGVILFNIDVEMRNAGLAGDTRDAQIISRNIIDVAQVQKLNEFLSKAALDAGRPPLFISIDQEGGRVARLLPQHGFDFVMPSAQELSMIPSEVIYDKYKELGLKLHGLGFNVNFAPATDVNVNPDSPAIGALGRSYSADAKLVTEYGRMAAGGLYDAGIISSFKHFPGHGSAGTDTHAGLTDITNTWQEYELEPYTAIPDNTMVMVAHVLNKRIDPTYPATLSHKTVNELLREKLGFQGVVITDDLQMGAIYDEYGFAESLRLAILAGNDVLLFGNNLQYTENIGRLVHEEIMKMVHNGDIPRSRIQESYERIIKLKDHVNPH
ncbi:MAG: hypothetical protein LBV04_07185 [Deferribacteraceae bacterium]|jgi:beta-N-acetylhexosaminidase|nr:hypothetical protein [Deferribacteraceae bacterium]